MIMLLYYWRMPVLNNTPLGVHLAISEFPIDMGFKHSTSLVMSQAILAATSTPDFVPAFLAFITSLRGQRHQTSKSPTSKDQRYGPIQSQSILHMAIHSNPVGRSTITSQKRNIHIHIADTVYIAPDIQSFHSAPSHLTKSHPTSTFVAKPHPKRESEDFPNSVSRTWTHVRTLHIPFI